MSNKRTIPLPLELEVIALELSAWLKQNVESRHQMADLCQRWGTTQKAVEAFLAGDRALPVETLQSMSLDTDIPVGALLEAAAAARITGTDTKTLERIINREEPLSATLLDDKTCNYKENDFTPNCVWVRASAPRVARKGSLFTVTAGLQLLNHENYVVEFAEDLPAGVVGGLVYPDGHLTIWGLTYNRKCAIIRQNQRLGAVRLAPAKRLRMEVYNGKG